MATKSQMKSSTLSAPMLNKKHKINLKVVFFFWPFSASNSAIHPFAASACKTFVIRKQCRSLVRELLAKSRVKEGQGFGNGHKKAPAVKTTMQMCSGGKLQNLLSTWRKMECTFKFSGGIWLEIITKLPRTVPPSISQKYIKYHKINWNIFYHIQKTYSIYKFESVVCLSLYTR